MDISILMNWRTKRGFGATRGSSEGNPFSSFLFTLVLDGLSKLMGEALEVN